MIPKIWDLRKNKNAIFVSRKCSRFHYVLITKDSSYNTSMLIAFVMWMIRSCVWLITIELENEKKHNKKTFQHTHNRQLFCYCCSYPPKRFYISLLCLKSLNTVETPKDFCLLTKENKETRKKKSLDLLLHERRSFLSYVLQCFSQQCLWLVPICTIFITS